MRKLTQFIVSIFLIAFLINTSYGFPWMAGNNSTAQTGNITQPGRNGTDLNNTTQSDQDIQLLFHLIEVDAVQLQSQNELLVRETLVFKNIGTKNFSGYLRTWVQDQAEGIGIERSTMSGTFEYNPQLIRNGSIISWRDQINTTNLPPLYYLGYVFHAEPNGTITKTIRYSKILLYPTLTKQPRSLVLKVTRSNGESVTITDEKGSSISASGNPKEEDNSVSYGWEMPDFTELNIEISKPAAAPAGIAAYAILGIVIVLAISYPIIRKKSERLQALEGKIRNSLKREEAEESGEEAALETVEETIEETGEAVEEDTELEGKTRDELETMKNEMLSKLGELDKDYEAGNLLDEEYEELRKPYQEKIERITRRIEQPG